MNTYADDLATVMDKLDLRKAVMVGFSTGGGEVARYIGRHGSKRVAGVALVSAVPPLMLKTAANPGGLPIDVFDGLRASETANRAQLYKDIASGPFFGFNRPRREGLARADRLVLGRRACRPATRPPTTASRPSRRRTSPKTSRKFDVPTLIVHGDDDQIVPIDASGRATAKLVKNAKLIVYPGAPHGLTDTHKDKLNADLLAFVKGIAA